MITFDPYIPLKVHRNILKRERIRLVHAPNMARVMTSLHFPHHHTYRQVLTFRSALLYYMVLFDDPYILIRISFENWFAMMRRPLIWVLIRFTTIYLVRSLLLERYSVHKNIYRINDCHCSYIFISRQAPSIAWLVLTSYLLHRNIGQDNRSYSYYWRKGSQCPSRSRSRLQEIPN